MVYFLLCVAILIANLMPAFVPPTWTIIVFAVNYDNLNIPLVILIAVLAATTGRFFLMEYIEWFSSKIFNKWEEDNLKFLGNKIGKSPTKDFFFTLLYAMTPLPTTQFFLAAAMAKLPKLPIIAGFFLGRAVSYTVLAYTSIYVVKDLKDLVVGKITSEGILTAILSILILLVLIFLDWKALLIEKKLKLNFRIWRWTEMP